MKTLFFGGGLVGSVYAHFVVQSRQIDGWLTYHAALVSPLVGALYKHDCDNYPAAKDKETLRALVRAAKEGFRVLKSLGYCKRQPVELNLICWLPEIMSMRGGEGVAWKANLRR